MKVLGFHIIQYCRSEDAIMVLHPEFFLNIFCFHSLKFKFDHIHTLGGNI